MNKLLSIQNITVRYLDQTLFADLTFDISKGEHWALVGESGSGKSALMQTIAGKFNVVGGSIYHYYFEDMLKANPEQAGYLTHHKLIAMVSAKHGFKNLSNTTDLYYQQRFNSFDSEDAPTVEAYLNSIEPVQHSEQIWTLERVIDRLKLQHLRHKELIKLSNGETKRLRIAAALLKHPVLLLLDNPLTGLDVQSRAEFNQMINEIITSGITVVIATSPNEIPDAVTNIAILKDSLIIEKLAHADFKSDMVHIPETTKIDAGELQKLLSATPAQTFGYIVKMRQVSIKYGENQVLDKIDWTVKQGEHWALLGPNGAGKSTLLSLINGDNPQAYANDIVLFDRKRGTGESIWEIKSKIGFVSPELHQYFPTENSCLQVIESGFYDTLGLFRPSQPAKAAIALQWMRLLELEADARKPLKNLSASKQRLVLLARALVKNPPLLIFDEPCQGLDAHQQLHFKHVVDAICSMGNTTLIYVTHYQHEIPDSVDLIIRLDKGKRVK